LSESGCPGFEDFQDEINILSVYPTQSLLNTPKGSGKDAKEKVTVRIIENSHNLIIQLQLNILLIL
jgi:hypothetical protein